MCSLCAINLASWTIEPAHYTKYDFGAQPGPALYRRQIPTASPTIFNLVHSKCRSSRPSRLFLLTTPLRPYMAMGS